jgi:hypothetical protein
VAYAVIHNLKYFLDSWHNELKFRKKLTSFEKKLSESTINFEKNFNNWKWNIVMFSTKALIIGIFLTFSRNQQLQLRLRNVKESIKILIIFCIQLNEICCKVKRLSPAVNFKFPKLWYWPSLKLTWSSFNDSILLMEIFGSLWWRQIYFNFNF